MPRVVNIKEKIRECQEVARFEERLVLYKTRGSCIFLDPEFGEFSTSWQNFTKKGACHPKRKKKKAHNALSLSEASLRLSEVHPNFELLEFSGFDKTCTFRVGEETFRRNYAGLLRSKNVKLKISQSPAAIAKKELKRLKGSIGEKDALKQRYRETNQKRQETLKRRYGVSSYAKLPGWRDEYIKGRIRRGTSTSYSGKSLKKLAKELGKSYTTLQSQVKRYGIDCALNISGKRSSIEVKMQRIVEELNIPYAVHEKISTASKNYISDISCGNLVIECDGLYWHSELRKSRLYHKEKRDAYFGVGREVLFFREDEILAKPDIIKSIILNKKGLSKKIQARSCEVVELSSKDNCFFKENHLMGKGSGKILSLSYGGDFVCSLQWKWKSKSKREIEISRFCTKKGLSVIGGFSRLISRLLKTQNPSSVVTFVDLRYGSGKYLEKLGWTHEGTHLSFSWTDGKSAFHRMRFPKNSGYEAGFFKIWDCGQAKWCLRVEDETKIVMAR